MLVVEGDYVEVDEEIYKLIKLTPVFNSNFTFYLFMLPINNRENWKNA